MRPEDEALARGLADAVETRPGDWEALRLAAVISSMEQELPDEGQHERFRELCDLAEVAFPDKTTTDSEILASAATPVLLHYLLDSLRRYNARAGGKELAQARRAVVLAEAMMMLGTREYVRSGSRDRYTGKWSLAHRVRYVTAYAETVDALARAEGGVSRDDAYDRGVQAAYAIYREGEAAEQDESDRNKVLRRLRDLIEDEGYGIPPKRR